MKMTALTSLADLVFKAKTDRHYKQLARIGATRMRDGKFNPITISYEDALEFLYAHSLRIYGCESCHGTVENLNYCRSRVVEEKDPVPVVEAVAASTIMPCVDTAAQSLMELVKNLKMYNDASNTAITRGMPHLVDYSEYNRQFQIARSTMRLQEEAVRSQEENRRRTYDAFNNTTVRHTYYEYPVVDE